MLKTDEKPQKLNKVEEGVSCFLWTDVDTHVYGAHYQPVEKKFAVSIFCTHIMKFRFGRKCIFSNASCSQRTQCFSGHYAFVGTPNKSSVNQN